MRRIISLVPGLFVVLSISGISHAQNMKFSVLCPHLGTFKDEDVKQNAVLVFDASNFSSTKHATVYWKVPAEDSLKKAASQTEPLASRISGVVFVAVCRLGEGNDATLEQKSVLILGSPAEQPFVPGKNAPEHDKLFLLENVSDAGYTTVQITVTSTDNKKVPLDTVLLQRHKKVYFAASGGLLLTRATATTYSVAGVPTTLTTNTVITSSTVNNSTGATTSSSMTTTNATSQSTSSFAFATRGDSLQMNAVGGLTIYPFGHDNFPINGKGFTSTYAFKNKKQALGFFLGTSLNTLGNFTVAPSFEVFPGVQPFAGVTWWKKDKLLSGIVPCSGLGTSPSYSTPPSSTSTSISTSIGPPSTTTTMTTTIQTTAHSNCLNANVATIVSGTTAQTSSTLTPAFSFGILFNTNLLSAFNPLKK